MSVMVADERRDMRARIRDRRASLGWTDPRVGIEQKLLELRVARRAIEELAIRAVDPDEWASFVGIAPGGLWHDETPEPDLLALLTWFCPPGVPIGSDAAITAAKAHLMRLIARSMVPDDLPCGVGIWPVAIDRRPPRGAHAEPWAIRVAVEPGSVVAADTQVDWQCVHGTEVVHEGQFVAAVMAPPRSSVGERLQRVVWPRDPCPQSPDHQFIVAASSATITRQLCRIVAQIPAALDTFVNLARGLALNASRADSLAAVIPGGAADAGDLQQIAVDVLHEAAVRYAGPNRPAAALSSWLQRRVTQVQGRAVTELNGESERIGHARARMLAGDDISDLSPSAQRRVRQGRPTVVSLDASTTDDEQPERHLAAVGADASAEDAFLCTDASPSMIRLLALVGERCTASTDLTMIADAVRAMLAAPWGGDVVAMCGDLVADGQLVEPDLIAERWLGRADATACEVALSHVAAIEGHAAAECCRRFLPLS